MGGHLRSDFGSDLPPDDVREWITRTAIELRATLANPAVRSRVIELLNGSDATRGDDENDTGA
jgi:hypothetical protein